MEGASQESAGERLEVSSSNNSELRATVSYNVIVYALKVV